MKHARAIEPASKTARTGKSNRIRRSTVRLVPTPAFLAIERERKRRAMTATELCRLAIITPTTYYTIRAGRHRMGRITRIRLERALEGAPLPRKAAANVVRAFHRAVMAVLAFHEGRNADAVLATDFERQRPSDAEWLAASRIRAMATDLAVCELGLTGADVARALGVSKMGITKQLRRAADLRDDPGIERLLDKIAATLTGRA